MSGTLKIGSKTLVTHDTSSNKLAFHSDANDTGQLCRAWVNFNGTITGTQVGSDYHFTTANNGIRAAYNVDYIIDRGLGDYEIHFENAMPDVNYACLLMTSNRASTSGAYAAIGYHTTDNTNASAYLAGSIRIFIKRADSTTVDDKGEISVAVFR